jgi:hypothetical protein
MRKIIFGLVLLLAACGQYTKDYQPKLAEQPKDPIKYEADRQYCFTDVERRGDIAAKAHISDDRVMGAFGLLGYAAVTAEADPNDDYFRPLSQQFDECMAARGYKVVSEGL